jgi:hypothetical protein
MQAVLSVSNRVISSYEEEYQLSVRDTQSSISNLAEKKLPWLIAYIVIELAIHRREWYLQMGTNHFERFVYVQRPNGGEGGDGGC